MADIAERLFEILTPGRIIGCVCIFLAASFIVDLATRPSYPDSIPRVGYGTGMIASIKNYFLCYARHKAWVEEGYEKYTKHNQAFVLPSGLGRRSVVVLPRSQIKWLIDQPDSLVSPDEANNDSLYAKYNFLGKRDPQDPFNNRTIHRNLIRALGDLIPGMQEEVQDSIDRVFGLDTNQWNSLNIWDMWLGIIPQITNRMIVGKDLARNPKLLANMVNFTESVLRNVFIFDFLSRSLHPVLGPLFAIPNWIYYLRAARVTLPVIKKRIEDMERKFRDPAYKEWAEPEDFITWCVRQARAEGNAYELNPSTIMKRTLLVEVASIHTTAMTAQNTMLDLLSSNPSQLEALREEADRVFREGGHKWTKAGLAKLHRIDSAIRESQRHSNFAVTLLDHKVIAQEGITNKAQGWHLPYGSTMTLNLNGVYHDPDLHKDSESYDPLRYSKPIDEYEALRDDDKNPSEGEKFTKMGMVTTSEEHLIFGHGRHACPGRFFVAHELKMAIAYMLLNYEIKHIPIRQGPTIMGNFVLPPFKAQMEVRRRQGTTLQPRTLFGRTQDAKHPRPILNDTWAGYVLNQIDYDFTKLKMDRMQSIAICMRSRTFDRWTSEFIRRHEDTGATVVCLACGLDSRSLRLNWGSKIRWVDLDLPDVVALRRKLLPEPSGDYKLVGASVTDDAWLQEIPADRPTLVVLEGLVMYLEAEDGENLIRRLVEHFQSGQLAFDAVGSLMITLQAWNRMLKATGTTMPWGLDKPQALEALNSRLKLCDVARFGDQDGANELAFPVRCIAWALSNLPYIKDLGYMLRYEF